jgi:hypothetical protein
MWILAFSTPQAQSALSSQDKTNAAKPALASAWGVAISSNAADRDVPIYAVRFSRFQLGNIPPGWSDLVNYRPTRNWAVDGNGLLRVMLKEYVGNPTTGDRLVRREYLETYGVKHFVGLLAYDGALADGSKAKQLENVRLKTTFKKTADPNVLLGLFLRLADRDNYFAARFIGSNQLQVVKVNGGQETVLKSVTSQTIYPGEKIWTLEFAADGRKLSARLLDDQQHEQATLDVLVERVSAGLTGLTVTTFAAAESFAISVPAGQSSIRPLEAVLADNIARAAARNETDYPVVKPVAAVEPLNTKFNSLADEYDVVVAGAGTGGWGAAVQAARMGAKVLLLEETDWIGGQMSAAAVTSMDEGGIWGKNPVRERGIYREFHESIVNHYYTQDKDPFAAYHFNRQSEGGYEPRIARGVLYGLIQETRQRHLPDGRQPVLDLCVRTKVTAVEKQENTVHGVKVEEWTENGSRAKTIKCRVLVDATEYGDVLPLAGARYRLGISTSDKLDATSPLQEHTWTGVIREYPGGVPEHLKIKSPPPGFELMEKRFKNYRLDGVRDVGLRTKGDKTPRHWSSYVDWRGMVDSARDAIGEPTEQWHTRCGLNGGNDYPVTAATVEDLQQRYRDEGGGINKTLGIIYWFQHTLGLPWAVAEDEGYYSPLNAQLMRARGVREDLIPIAARLPQHPYVRECRRLIGVETIRGTDIYTRDRGKETGRHWPDAVAINDYSIDLHGTRDQIELDLDEPDYVNATGPFQIPFGVFIPELIDGLLPAEKNFSQSRLVNGATRLQPSTMLTGQAVGVIAALSVEKKVPARQLNVIDVQTALLASGDTLISQWYSDVVWGTPLWRATQLLALYGIMNRPGPMDKTPLGEGYCWGADQALSSAEANQALKKLKELVADQKQLPTRLQGVANEKMKRGEFALMAAEALGKLGHNWLNGPVSRPAPNDALKKWNP